MIYLCLPMKNGEFPKQAGCNVGLPQCHEPPIWEWCIPPIRVVMSGDEFRIDPVPWCKARPKGIHHTLIN